MWREEKSYKTYCRQLWKELVAYGHIQTTLLKSLVESNTARFPLVPLAYYALCTEKHFVSSGLLKFHISLFRVLHF